MIILPTMGRPENLKRFVNTYNFTGGTLPIWVIFDSSDAYLYNDVKTPDHWRRCSVPSGMRLGDIFNRIFSKYPNEDYYAMVADDVIPETYGWDVIMADLSQPSKIVWGWDGIQNDRLPVHPFIGGDLVRKLGFWAAPGVKHCFVDNAWKSIADALDCGVYLPDVKMTHNHYANGKAMRDRTYDSQPPNNIDEIAYLRFMKEDFNGAIERVKNHWNK